jgi:hypothetical protein
MGSLFFGTGPILDIFYSAGAGKLELVSTVLNMCRTQGRIIGKISFKNLSEISSSPTAFDLIYD